MTLFWMNRLRPGFVANQTSSPEADAPAEYDEEGRRYVFRYPKVVPHQHRMDRERLFAYIATHALPDIRDRSIRRDLRNAANFFEDVRDLQTHPDVVAIALEQSSQIARLRLRSAS